MIQACLSNKSHFLWFYQHNKPTTGCLGECKKKIANHEPEASDLQAFQENPTNRFVLFAIVVSSGQEFQDLTHQQ